MTGPASRRRLRAPRIRTRTGAELGVRRLRWTLVLFGLLMIVAVGKLVEIQVVNADSYAESGVRQRARTIDLTATRGRIYDRDGDVLATSVEAATVYADPRLFRPSTAADGSQIAPGADAGEVAATLAPLLDRDEGWLEQRLTSDRHFVYLGRQLDHDVGEQVERLELPGIGVLSEPRRVYPAGPLAAQTVGFTGLDGDGLQGLEARYDPVLAGRPGMLVLERAPGGLDIASGMRELVPPEVGTDLVLTLDREIQHAAEHAAAQALEEHDARGASVLVQDVGTGEVLGMASAPDYDPNERDADEDRDTWRNRAVTDVFEPGSAQKALTIAAAVEEGLVSADTRLEVPDNLTVHGKRFTDVGEHDEEVWSVAEIMERSSNVGTIKIAQELGDQRLESYLRAFGLGSVSGLGFPGETAGLLMPHEQWWGTSLPTIAIGQGVGVTLLQLSSAYATVANAGVAVEPTLVRGTVGEDGRLTPATAPDQQQVVSGDTAAQVAAMLEDAVSGEHGTGHRASVDGHRVAGKTGTARKPSDGELGYSDQYVATFVGFAPVDDPRVVVAVMIDEPEPIYGGVVAAPVFAEVMGSALRSLRVPPDSAGRDLADSLAEAAERRDATDADAADAGDEAAAGATAAHAGNGATAEDP